MAVERARIGRIGGGGGGRGGGGLAGGCGERGGGGGFRCTGRKVGGMLGRSLTLWPYKMHQQAWVEEVLAMHNARWAMVTGLHDAMGAHWAAPAMPPSQVQLLSVSRQSQLP